MGDEIMNKKLVCYFSATGATKMVASRLASMLNADLFEIEPVDIYTDADLDWNDKNSRTSLENDDASVRPSIKNKVSDISLYNDIYIGFPVWWYKEPSIIDTFIEENDLSGKNIYVFVTSGGSSVTSSLDSLKNKYKKLNFVSGLRLNSNMSISDISSFI